MKANKFIISALCLSLGAMTLAGCQDKAAPAKEGAEQAPVAAAPQENAAAPAAATDKVTMNVTGAGASFPQPIYVQWAQGFLEKAGGQVNYQSIGSSGGVKQIVAKTVDFGATDSPMSAEELDKEGLVQFPTVIGGVVPIVNIEGVEAGALKLTGDVLAQIYLGDITKWNDPKIAELNPDLTLPDENIVTVFRSDGSGTSFIFTNYLSQVSAKWKDTVGADKTVKWPTAQTGTAGKGNEGVATYVGRVKNSIGYVEYAYAKQNNLAYTKLYTADGKVVSPSADNFSAAAKDAKWSESFAQDLTNQTGDNAWPITSTTFILLQKTQADAAKAKEVLKFFDWAYASGDKEAVALDYAVLPDNVVEEIKKAWASELKDANGKAL